MDRKVIIVNQVTLSYELLDDTYSCTEWLESMKAATGQTNDATGAIAEENLYAVSKNCSNSGPPKPFASFGENNSLNLRGKLQSNNWYRFIRKLC